MNKKTIKNYLFHGRVLHGASWLLFGNILWKFFSSISMIIVARILGKEAYGEFGLIKSTIDVFVVFAGFRFASTATRYIAKYKLTDKERASNILSLTLLSSIIITFILSLLCASLSNLIGATLLSRPTISHLVFIGSFFLFFYSNSIILENCVVGFEAYKQISIINCIKGILSLIFLIPFTYYFGVKGLIYGLSVVSLISGIFFFKLLRNKKLQYKFTTSYRLKNLTKDISVLYTFALPGILSGLIITFSMWYSRVILVNTIGGYGELGLFSAANQIRSLVLFLPAILGRVFLPILSEAHGEKCNDKFARTVKNAFKNMWIISLPFTIFVITFSDEFYLLFGDDFIRINKILPYLIISVFFYAVSVPLRQAFDGANKRWTNLIFTFIWSAVFISSNYILLDKYQSIGLALSYLISYFILVLLQYVYIDIKLTKFFISKDYKLFFFSIFLILISVFINVPYLMFHGTFFNLLILIASITPLIYYIKVRYTKVLSNLQ